jgi:hypothetical protein
MQLQADYFAAYRSLKLAWDADGVLVVEFHSKGGPFRFTAQHHAEFIDAFYRIAQDRENEIAILTRAGGEFIPEIDFSSFGNVANPGVWSQVHKRGREVSYGLSLEGASAADVVKSRRAQNEPVPQKGKVA